MDPMINMVEDNGWGFSFEFLVMPDLPHVVSLQVIDFYFLLPSKGSRIIGQVGPLLGMVEFLYYSNLNLKGMMFLYDPCNLCGIEGFFSFVELWNCSLCYLGLTYLLATYVT